MVKTRLNITGQRFGRLVAVSPHSQDQFRRWKWNCLCDCGRAVVASSNNLRTGNSKSCGCLDNERSAESGRRHFSAYRGDRHYRWISDRSSLKGRPASIKKWRSSIIEGNPGGCFKCGSSEGLHAHHADAYSGFPQRRFDTTNGVPLCARHHREFHSIYGRDSTTQEQLHDYLGYPPAERALIEAPAQMPSDPLLRHVVDLVIAGDLKTAHEHLEREIARLKKVQS